MFESVNKIGTNKFNRWLWICAEDDVDNRGTRFIHRLCRDN